MRSRSLKKDQYLRIRPQAKKNAEKQLVKILVPGIKKEQKQSNNQFEQMMNMFNASQQPADTQEEVTEEIRVNRRTVLEQLQKGLLDNREVTIEVQDQKKTSTDDEQWT